MSRTKQKVESLTEPKDEGQLRYEKELADSQKPIKDELTMSTIHEAIANFQAEVPVLIKNTQGYGYKYAELSEIMNIINPILRKHDLYIMQPLTKTGIKTVVTHIPTGESIESYCEIPQDVELKGMNAFQAYGSAITYFRRYSLSSFFTLISDVDSDASGEQVKKTISKPVSKKKITDVNFVEALMMIEKGTYTVEKLKSNYDLTPNQLKKLNDA